MNKSDLYSREILKLKEKEGKTYADSINAIFSLASTMKNEGISEVIFNIAQLLLHSPKPKEGDHIKIPIDNDVKVQKCCK